MAKFPQPWLSFHLPFLQRFSYLLRRQVEVFAGRQEEEVEEADVVVVVAVVVVVVVVAWTMVESLMLALVCVCIDTFNKTYF